KGKKERISRLVRMHANKQEEVSEVKIGDIVAIIGLKYTTTGDTLCGEEKDILLEQISFTEPVISSAIEPKTKKDQEELSRGLKSLSEEDPTFRYRYDSKTREMIISGMGELHLEILVERLKTEFGVEVKVGKPQVAYQETIKNEVEIEYTHKKQTGGAGQYAKIKLKFEPLPEGEENDENEDFKFDCKKFKAGGGGGEKFGRGNCFVPAIKKGLKDTFLQGHLLGSKVINVKATLLDGGWHPVDSSDLAFQLAAYYTFHENRSLFQSVLLEPIMKLEVSNIPEDYYGTVLASITSKRGIIESIEKKREFYLLKAQIPLAETFGYSTVLRSLTEGRATHSLQFSHYQEVPLHIMEELVGKK